MGPEMLATYYYQKFCARLPNIMSWMWLKGTYSSIYISPLPWSKNKGAYTSPRCSVPVERLEAFTPHLNDIGENLGLFNSLLIWILFCESLTILHDRSLRSLPDLWERGHVWWLWRL